MLWGSIHSCLFSGLNASGAPWFVAAGPQSPPPSSHGPLACVTSLSPSLLFLSNNYFHFQILKLCTVLVLPEKLNTVIISSIKMGGKASVYTNDWQKTFTSLSQKCIYGRSFRKSNWKIKIYLKKENFTQENFTQTNSGYIYITLFYILFGHGLLWEDVITKLIQGVLKM